MEPRQEFMLRSIAERLRPVDDQQDTKNYHEPGDLAKELAAMSGCWHIIESLSDAARLRVVRWLLLKAEDWAEGKQ